MKKTYVNANVLIAAFQGDELTSPEVLKETSKISRLFGRLDRKLWAHLKLPGNKRGLLLRGAVREVKSPG